MTNYLLYSSEGCHLCELALAICQPIFGEQLSVVDIVDDEALVELYGIHIPVLTSIKSGNKLFWPFEREQVLNFAK